MLMAAACIPQKRLDDGTVVATIEPVRFLIDNITGGDLKVVTLVPPGASPETYEPTASQIIAAEKAALVFTTGLIDFEKALLGRLPDKARFVDLGKGIETIEGACSHIHGAEGHSHGVDPHIWMSPRALVRMAANAYERIAALYPDSVSWAGNYARLDSTLRALDRQTGEKIAASGVRSFVIFHPGLTYFARDYGLRQIALEHEGKEPSARQLRGAIEEARSEGIGKVFYQSEFPLHTVEVAAAGIGAEPVLIDILGYDVAANISTVTDLIARQ